MRCPTLADLPTPQPDKAGWPWTEDYRAPDLTTSVGNNWPRISIVTANFNSARYLEEAIRSVLLQAYPNLEYIIMDGGSTDNSVEIIKKYEPWLAYWTSRKDGGQSSAINDGWRRATGEIVAWMNADDLYCKGAIHRAVKALEEIPDAAMVYGQLIAIGPEGRRFAALKTPANFSALTMLRTFNNIVPSITAFMRKPAVEDIGPLDSDLHYTMDFEYFTRLGLRYPVVQDLSIQSYARVHDQAKSSKGFINGLLEMYSIVSRVRKASQDTEVIAACFVGQAVGAARLSAVYAQHGDMASALRWRSISVAHALHRPFKSGMWSLLLPGTLFPWTRRYRPDYGDDAVTLVHDEALATRSSLQ